MIDSEASDTTAAARRLLRGSAHAALATSLAGWPYASLVAVACAIDGSPLLLLSDLAQHSHNIAADARVSLLFTAAAMPGDPLAAGRLSLLGRAERCDDPRAAARYAARHPASAGYAGFADFKLYRVDIERGHLVAGFGRIAWVARDELRCRSNAASLGAAEAEIIAHMNADHADAVALYAERLLGRGGSGWRMTGIDPEGIDLRREEETARLDFAAPASTPAEARQTLAALAAAARQAQPR
ncbi:MAG TPA: DUF2470 domain-containing protein [Stellaceae bacterium]|nr:DUF2470 domain-containing protein [Stellaceae bacterium]